MNMKIEKKELKYRWTQIVDNFDMPIKVSINEKLQWLFPTSDWKTMALETRNTSLKVDRNFYVYTKNI